MKYNDLDKLNELRSKGAITEEEYQREKKRILNQPFERSGNLWGMDNRTYCMIMHLAQFIPGPGWLVSIILWAVARDKDTFVDENGKIIINWLVTFVIFLFIFWMLKGILIGFPLLGILGVCNVVFVIIGAIKSYNYELWPYPLSFKVMV